VVNLPAIGIKGYSRLPMIGKTNGATPDLIEKWRADKGPARETAGRLMG
jgi:hypothetical protein